ncbi:MAG: FtsX-like permease family protein [Rectinema sp.]
MPVIIRMAFRNILEHKSKSLIVGVLLAMGALILVLGNSFINASQMGIRTMFTESYTGDVFISGKSLDGDVSLFGVMSMGGSASTPTIPEYEKTYELIRNTPGVAKLSGMATGFGITVKDPDATMGDGPQNMSQQSGDDAESGSDDTEAMAETMASRFLFLFGVDAKDYWSLFDTVEIVSGSLLEPGQSGLIVNENQLANMSKALKRDLKVGDMVLVQGISSGGMRLREMPILGTYRAKGEGAAPEQLAFADIDSVRILAGMTVGASENIVLEPEQTAMLSVDDTDSLFGDELLAAPISQGSVFDEAALTATLADTSVRDVANQADRGAWQYIVVRTEKPSDALAVAKSLNETFAREGIDAVAGDWQKAAGPYGQSVDVVRIVFLVAVIILIIVAIIIIMNTFVISVIERTGEIGTMRAMGAGRGFVRRMFAVETGVLSLVFSTLGASLGAIIAAILRASHIEAGNPFFEILFGGKYLNLVVTPGNFAGAVLAMVVVGFLAHLYPVSVALKIQPVRAMQSE